MGLQPAHINAINPSQAASPHPFVIFSALVCASYAAAPVPPPTADVMILIPGVIPTSVPNNAVPAFAPDESYLIFCSGRAPAPSKGIDLFMVFRTGNGWSEPIDLRPALSEDVHGVEARLSPDGKTLYFSNAHSPRMFQTSSF